MVENSISSKKLTLDQAIQVLRLTSDLKFVAKKVFKPTDSFTESQWKDKLQKKGIKLN
jgi:hypothetical protein